MSGGRWNAATRAALVFVGFVLVSFGVVATLRFASGAGAAVLVAGGLAVGLAGVAGGLSFARIPSAEARYPAAEAPPAGDADTALDRFAQALRLHAPESARYHDAATQAMYQAAGRTGEQVRPLYSFLLSPLAMSGSLVLIDIRGGTGSSLTRMQSTYHALLVGPPPIFDAVLVVLDAPATHPDVDAVNQVGEALDRPVVAVGWRVDDPLDALVAGMERIRQETGRRAALDESDVDTDSDVDSDVDSDLDSDLDDSDLDDDSHYDDVEAVPEVPDGDEPVPTAGTASVPRQPQDGATRLPASVPPVAPPAVDAVPGQRTPEFPESPEFPEVPEPSEPSGQVGPARVDGPAPAAGGTASAGRGPAPVDGPTSADDPAAPGATAAAVPSPRQGYNDNAAWRRVTDLHWQGQLDEAEAAYRQIISDRARALGPGHPDTLAARDQHATVLRDLDRLAEAQRECEDVLAARTYALGADDPDTLTSRSHLATIYHQLGELAEAEQEHQRVLDARTRVLGPTHQETLISRSNLAKVHQDLGQLDRAIDEHRQVLQARIELLGAEHRDPLMSRSLLAAALHQAGRLEEAADQHGRVLDSRLQLLGPVHLDTAVSRHRLASVLHDLGLLDQAIAEYRAAHEVYSELLGAQSPFARAAASDLAVAERAARR